MKNFSWPQSILQIISTFLLFFNMEVEKVGLGWAFLAQHGQTNKTNFQVLHKPITMIVFFTISVAIVWMTKGVLTFNIMEFYINSTYKPVQSYVKHIL